MSHGSARVLCLAGIEFTRRERVNRFKSWPCLFDACRLLCNCPFNVVSFGSYMLSGTGEITIALGTDLEIGFLSIKGRF